MIVDIVTTSTKQFNFVIHFNDTKGSVNAAVGS